MKELSNKIQNIIFDLDGTLWDPIDSCLKAWHEEVNNNKIITTTISKKDLEGVFGMQHDLIGKKLFPYLEEKQIESIMISCYKNENKILSLEGGKLYNNLEDTLKSLSKKYNLYIVSNCQAGYIESFYKFHGLKKYFKDQECSGNTGRAKEHNISLIIKRNSIKNPIYIGDTQGDFDATNKNNIPFIFATYGFGKVLGHKYKIDKIDELKILL